MNKDATASCSRIKAPSGCTSRDSPRKPCRSLLACNRHNASRNTISNCTTGRTGLTTGAKHRSVIYHNKLRLENNHHGYSVCDLCIALRQPPGSGVGEATLARTRSRLLRQGDMFTMSEPKQTLRNVLSLLPDHNGAFTVAARAQRPSCVFR